MGGGRNPCIRIKDLVFFFSSFFFLFSKKKLFLNILLPWQEVSAAHTAALAVPARRARDRGVFRSYLPTVASFCRERRRRGLGSSPSPPPPAPTHLQVFRPKRMPTLVTPLGGNSLHFTQLPLETKIGFIPDFFFFFFTFHATYACRTPSPASLATRAKRAPYIRLSVFRQFKCGSNEFPSRFGNHKFPSLVVNCRRDVLSVMIKNKQQGAFDDVCDITKG